MRMRSNRPKSLQEIGGKPMLRWIVDCVQQASFDRIHIVHGHDGDELKECIVEETINWVFQSEPLGTGHAVAKAIDQVNPSATVCVLYGDIPLIQPQTIKPLVELANRHELALLTVELTNPTGYGRIKRADTGSVVRVVEEKDASSAEREILEVNAGPIAAKAQSLKQWLQRLNTENSQNEYYLTDVIEFAATDGVEVAGLKTALCTDTSGVNSRIDQANLERTLQKQNAQKLMQDGLQLIDPVRFDLRGECTFGKDCRIDPNVIVSGRVELGDGVSIGANNEVTDSKLADGVTILGQCSIVGAQIGTGSIVGPFARLRPGTVIGENCRVGNFVEIKSATIGDNSKINHHAYVGDSTIGESVNIGAGAITCNYDGKRKSHTFIGDKAFIGSNVSLIAPIEIGNGAVIGAGSVISKSVKAGETVIERTKPTTIK